MHELLSAVNTRLQLSFSWNSSKLNETAVLERTSKSNMQNKHTSKDTAFKCDTYKQR